MLAGGCFCGDVRYRLEAPVFHETICHCPDCRKIVGAASVAWFSVARAGLRFTSGSPAAFHSSPGITRRFCGRCGTSLTYENEKLDEVDITICSLDQPGELAPKDHTHAAGRLPWDPICDGLPAYDVLRTTG